jgi:hypothetical protein
MIIIVYSILLAIEILIIAAAISNAIPYPHNPLYDRLFARFIYDGGVSPKRDLLLYTIFLLSCLGIQGVMVFVFGKKLSQKDFLSKITQLSIAQGFWVVVEVFAAFKICLYNGPLWAKVLFYGALAASVLHKIFWPEISKWLGRFYETFFELRHSDEACYTGDVVIIILIISVLWVTDWNKCLASLSHGYIPAGIQQFFSATLWGHVFNLANASLGAQVGFMVGVHLLYFIVLYVMLRVWLQEKFVAVFGGLMALKLQLFNESMMPCAWAHPAWSVLTHAWDVPFFFCLYFYIEKRQVIYIFAMTAICGMAIAFTPFAGLCLWLAMLIGLSSDPATRSLCRFAVAAPLLGWGLLSLMHGQWIWPEGGVAIGQQLAQRHYFSFFFGFVMLALYAIAILERESLWTLIIGIYGLLTFGQYALSAQPYGYYIYVLPFILLWIHKITKVPIKKLFYVRLILAVLTMVALLTNTVFLLYPNIWRLLF